MIFRQACVNSSWGKNKILPRIEKLFMHGFTDADTESFSSLPPPQLAIGSQSVVFNAGFYISRNTAKNLISSLMTH